MGISVAATLLALVVGASPAAESRSPVLDAERAGATPSDATRPAPEKQSALRRLAGDFGRTLTSEDSRWIFGIGGAATLLALPLDDSIQQSRFNSELHDSAPLDGVFEGGDLAGDWWIQLGAPLGLLACGKLAGRPPVMELGGDLLRAQIVAGTITTALKLATQRERPDGSSDLSFPSGHTSAAFATAAVVHGRYGWKPGVVAYAVAAWVGASRINENKHFLSDVTFGAAIGIAAGRAVTLSTRSVRVSVAPLVAPGARGVQVTLARQR
ncbi:MAG TPA: phosphatase PAP2 family protein [Vicinamibacteria bacterium]|nr:phosphatase PAP2 family protein [Vicinamibacteria bacterium]